jgi:glycosyltransferase involved in cell wall biosynthesis
MTRPRIAFVVQRAGVEVNGGAEYLCLAVARAMSSIWDVEIITTCALDYLTWADHYPAGVERIDGVTVRRFPVDKPRAIEHHNRMSRQLLESGTSATAAEQEAWMKSQGPYSTPLLRYIQENAAAYERFFFYTYLYATTYFGLPLVADKAVLVPFAHDEWPIHLPCCDALFGKPSAFVFSTPEERAFLQRRFPGATLAGPTIGIGVAAPGDVRPERFRHRIGLDQPYALYVGRIDASKGALRLIETFARYREHGAGDLALVLIGRPVVALPDVRGVHVAGFVDEATKFDALSGAVALVQPSALESLSIVLLEAWSAGRPVLVTAESDVLVGQTRRANGGLWYGDDTEFGVALQMLRGPVGTQLGECGRAFVEQNYRWPHVVEQYERLRLDLNSSEAPAGASR